MRLVSLAPALLLTALLGGCASQVPQLIREAPPAKLSVSQATAGQAQTGTRIRWGGTIASVDNQQNATALEIVERPLNGDGRPKQTDQTGGRFIARVHGFLDPEVYKTGREVTVAGALAGRTERTIGQHPYTFPLVDVTQVYLWPERREYPRYYDPFYDPWYDPWYPYPWGPWGPFPYRYRY
jgi:outer membrane lipoprotein